MVARFLVNSACAKALEGYTIFTASGRQCGVASSLPICPPTVHSGIAGFAFVPLTDFLFFPHAFVADWAAGKLEVRVPVKAVPAARRVVDTHLHAYAVLGAKLLGESESNFHPGFVADLGRQVHLQQATEDRVGTGFALFRFRPQPCAIPAGRPEHSQRCHLAPFGSVVPPQAQVVVGAQLPGEVRATCHGSEPGFADLVRSARQDGGIEGSRANSHAYRQGAWAAPAAGFGGLPRRTSHFLQGGTTGEK